jgi:LPXTG-motif cell wall-anchored protein
MKVRLFRQFLSVVCLSAVSLMFVTQQSQVNASGGSTLLNQTFNSMPTGADGWTFGGNSSTVSAGYPKVESRNSDSRLRLTRAVGNDGGYAIYNVPQTTAAGLDITMEIEMWGGGSTGADGMALFLIDGATTNVNIGTLGGALGYINLTGTGGQGALLGVGLDRWGGFRTANPSGSGAGFDCPTSFGFGLWADAITVRGPGSSGYNVITSSDPCSVRWGDTRATFGGTWTVRSSRVRTVRMVVDPVSVANPQVKIYVDDPDGVDPSFGGTPGVGPTATPRLTFAQPTELRNATTFKFGIAASTGGSTNNHDVLGIQVSTINPVSPVAWVTSSLPGGTIGTAYSQTLQAQDGVATYSYSLHSGSLPTGVTLSNGQLSGTPTTCGDYTFTLRVTDSQTQATFADRAFTVRVNDAQQSCVYVAPTTTTTTVVTTTSSVSTVRQNSSTLPKTGQTGGLMPLAVLSVVSGGLALVARRRRTI